MIKIKKHGVILRPTSLPFEDLSTFNPAIYQDGNSVHVFYRALDKKFVSSIGYARLKGPTKIIERWKKPFLFPKYSYEKHGIEDARIVKIKDEFYMTYVVHDGINALIAYSHGKNIGRSILDLFLNMSYLKASMDLNLAMSVADVRR